MAKCGKSKTDPHTCSNLHRLLAKSGKLLDVKISTLPLWIRYSRKRPQQALVKYPVLRMTDWVDCIFRHGGHFFLGGQSMDNAEAFGGQLYNFWENYQVVDPDFAFFREYPKAEWNRSIPIAIHGDEGRGKAKNPVMVVTVQILLPISGKKTNMQGCLISDLSGFIFSLVNYYVHWRKGYMIPKPSYCQRPSMCTRLLYTVLPSPYTRDSFQRLLRLLTDDLKSLQEPGFTVSPLIFCQQVPIL